MKATCCNCNTDLSDDSIDILGSCPGSGFCGGCGLEVNLETGKKSPPCNKCMGCGELASQGKEQVMFAFSTQKENSQ